MAESGRRMGLGRGFGAMMVSAVLSVFGVLGVLRLSKTSEARGSFNVMNGMVIMNIDTAICDEYVMVIKDNGD